MRGRRHGRIEEPEISRTATTPAAGVAASARGPHATVLIDPVSHHFENDRLFDLRTADAGESILAPYVHLRDHLQTRGLAVHTADTLDRLRPDPEKTVYISFGIRTRAASISRYGARLSAFFAVECPVVEPRLYRDLPRLQTEFARIFSYSTAAALRPFVPAPVRVLPFRLPVGYDSADECAWARRDRSFLVMINANKRPRLRGAELYSERLRALRYFGTRDEIDLFGIGWDGPTMHVGESVLPASARRAWFKGRSALDKRLGTRDPLLASARRAYRGVARSKLDTLSSYSFAICFENMVLEGWLTEKIFDCFLAGTIPVYLGAPDVERWVPRETFIDMRAFASYDELRAFLHDVGPRERDSYREAARDYLASDAFRPFTKHAFAELIGDVVVTDLGIES